MAINIYERAIQPIVDLDTDVVVYVPGYAIKGPCEPTIVTRENFTSLFGNEPYKFKNNQTTSTILKNKILSGSPDKSYLYAKGIVDSGLTVLFHRLYPNNIKLAEPTEYTYGGETSDAGFAIRRGTSYNNLTKLEKYIKVRAKYKGRYYKELKVELSPNDSNIGITTVKVTKGEEILETRTISLDMNSQIFIDKVKFSYVEFYVNTGYASLALDAWYAEAASGDKLYITGEATLDKLVKISEGEETVILSDEEDEVTVSGYETSISGSPTVTSCLDTLLDTERFRTISYITTGGYYQTGTMAEKLQKTAFEIKALALIDLGGEINTIENYTALKNSLTALGTDPQEKGKSTAFIGADTFTISGYTLVIADSYGYLAKLGSNIRASIPYWIPPANNPNGVVPAEATTREVTNTIRTAMQTKEGPSVNPIIYKQNVEFTIMGNRTLYPNDGILGPQSFLNCQVVINAVERSARRSAQDLLIVSTNPNTAFRAFELQVSKTCDKLLVNGDGLAAYKIYKLKKTKPATIDTVIELTVREGIEEWNITVPYQLQLD